MNFPGDQHFCFKTTNIQSEKNRVTLPKAHPSIDPDNTILWVRAEPLPPSNRRGDRRDQPPQTASSDSRNKRAIISPVILEPCPGDPAAAKEGLFKMPDCYRITPIKTTNIQSNYTTTIPKSFFPDYEGKTKYKKQQDPLFDYDSEVYFVKSPLLWRAAKSFYMLDGLDYQFLLTRREADENFISDGGQKYMENNIGDLDDGEVLDITNDEVIDVDEAIERLNIESSSFDKYDINTYYVGVDEDGEVTRERW